VISGSFSSVCPVWYLDVEIRLDKKEPLVITEELVLRLRVLYERLER
jgi:hypothetical protein